MNGKPMNDNHSRRPMPIGIAQLSIIAGVMFSLLGIIIFCVAYNMLKLDNSIGFVSVLSFTLPTLIGGLLLIVTGKILLNLSHLLKRMDSEPAGPQDP